jgi:hypothetical protein
MAARHLLLLLTGCSLTLSGPDPNRPRNKMPACDTSKSLVALDGVMAAALGTTALAIAGGNDSSAAVGPAVFGALYLVSAIHGNSVVNDCHREMENYDQAMAARDIVPPVRPAVMGPSMTPPVMTPPPVVAPQPVVAPPPADEPAPAPPPQPAPRAAGDRWSAFWREVP